MVGFLSGGKEVPGTAYVLLSASWTEELCDRDNATASIWGAVPINE